MASQIKCNITIKQPDSIEDNLIEHKIMKQNIMKTLNLNIPFFLFCKMSSNKYFIITSYSRV